jgi:hypothetical protein
VYFDWTKPRMFETTLVDVRAIYLVAPTRNGVICVAPASPGPPASCLVIAASMQSTNMRLQEYGTHDHQFRGCRRLGRKLD